MNDTNNNPVANNTTGMSNAVPTPAPIDSVPPVPAVQPAPIAQPAPVAQSAPAAVAPVAQPAAPTASGETQTTTSAENASVQASPVNNTNNTTVQNNNNNKGEANKTEFPYAAIVVGIIIVLIVLAYYFFYLTPTRILDNAIEDIFGNIKNFASGITSPENESMQVDLKGRVRTSGRDLENVENIKFLDNLIVNAKIQADLKELDYSASLSSEADQIVGMKYPENVNIAADYIDDKLYLELGDKVVKYQSTNNLENKLLISYERINDALSIFESMKDQVVDIIQEDELSKKLTTKKINNQTAISIKAHTKFNNDDISKIYYEGFGNLLKDKDFIKKWANVFAITEEEATLKLQDIYERKVVTGNIEVNLYMNLANTKLIGLDVTVGNFFIQIDSLNGFYYIDFKYLEDSGKEILNVELQYDTVRGSLIGSATLDIQTGFLIVEIDYNRISDENSKVMIGNTLDLKFYDGEDKKPFCIIECTLDLAYDKEIKLPDVSNAISIIELNNDEIQKLIRMKDKMTYEILFIIKKLALNRLGNLSDNVVETLELQVNDLFEKEMINMIEASLKQMPPQKLAVILGSAQGQQELLNKISFMSDENKAALLKVISEIK